MPLKSQDLHYIEEKLGITPEIAKLLTEDITDTNLLLNHVSVKEIKREDSRKISALTYLKLLIFRYSHDTTFEIPEKEYVAQSIYLNFTSIKREMNYCLISPKTKPNEQKSQYLLILSGFYSDSINLELFYKNIKNEISNGFRPKNISSHIDDWIYILREIWRKKWL
ncbi:MAG: hypothetical protein AABY22_15300 [Nanoarchaeota archaeon]